MTSDTSCGLTANLHWATLHRALLLLISHAFHTLTPSVTAHTCAYMMQLHDDAHLQSVLVEHTVPFSHFGISSLFCSPVTSQLTIL